MKRISLIILIICMLFSLCACRTNQSHTDTYANYYYRALELQYGTSEPVIVCERRSIIQFNNDFALILENYINGPKMSNHTTPFPAGTYLEQVTLGNDRAYVILSSHLSLLTGSDLTIACACLTKTVTELAGVHSVEISAKDGTLNGAPSMVLTEKDFSYFENYLVRSQKRS